MEQNPQNLKENYQPNFNQHENYFEKESEPYNDKPADPIMEPQPEINQKDMNNMFDEQIEQFNQEDDKAIDYTIRKGFIIKSYGILIFNLIITGIFICLSFVPKINDAIKHFVDGPFFMLFTALFLCVTIFVCIMFSCFTQVARRVPINYILLFSFTLSMSFYCLIFCAFFNPLHVIAALILTLFATIGITVYAMRTTTDFTFLGGILFCFSFVIFITIIFYFFIKVTALWLMLGVMCYSLYLIYDTQLIMGNIGISYGIDDYCLAALNLYIDIIYLFIKILEIIGRLRGN
jgi:FtsH-binding integral membrane protein